MSVEWQPESTAPLDKAVLIWAEDEVAVAHKTLYNTGDISWWIDNSHGYNEDGEIYGVTHWAELPEGPDHG